MELCRLMPLMMTSSFPPSHSLPLPFLLPDKPIIHCCASLSNDVCSGGVWNCHHWRNCVETLQYAPEIQSMIYTTNRIERLNRDFRRVLRMRTAMPNEDSVLTLMGSVAMEHRPYDRILPNITADKTLFPNNKYWQYPYFISLVGTGTPALAARRSTSGIFHDSCVLSRTRSKNIYNIENTEI